MITPVKFCDAMTASVSRNAMLRGNFLINSIWEIEHIRDGRTISRSIQNNIVTDQGLNYALDVALSGGTQITSWYVALFRDNHTPVAGDTYATPGCTETSNYSEGTRQAWTDGGVSGKSCTNSASKATFTMSATETIYGGMLVGGGSAASTKADTAGGGTLYCMSLFTVAKAVESGDELKVTITLTSQDV